MRRREAGLAPAADRWRATRGRSRPRVTSRCRPACPTGRPGRPRPRRAASSTDWLKALRRGHIKARGALLRAAEQVPERHAGADGQHRAGADRGQHVAVVRRGGDRDGRRRRLHDRQVQAHQASGRRCGTGRGRRRRAARSASSGARSRSGTACPTSPAVSRTRRPSRPVGVTVVAALYDVHGNLPALEAVLADEPSPARTRSSWAATWRRDRCRRRSSTAWRRSSCRCAGCAATPTARSSTASTVATPIPPSTRRTIPRRGPMPPPPRASRAHIATCWRASRTSCALDGALYCHGSPRRDDEIITAVTPEARLAPMLDGVQEALVVCGHTHHQFDLRAGGAPRGQRRERGDALPGRGGGLLAAGRRRRARPAQDRLRRRRRPGPASRDGLSRRRRRHAQEPARAGRPGVDRAASWRTGPSRSGLRRSAIGSVPCTRSDRIPGCSSIAVRRGEFARRRGTRRCPRPRP